jgi:O-antigen/teichoic acid export membrane protein
VRHLGEQTAMVMGGTVFTFLVGLPFQVYLARSLGTSGLGIVGVAEALVLTAAGLLSFGLAPLAMRYIPEYRTTGASQSIKLLVIVGVAAVAGLGTAGAAVLRPLVGLLPGAAGITSETAALLDVLVLLLPASMLSFFLAQSLRGFEEIRVVVLSTSILALSGKVAITLGLFAVFGVSARLYAWALVLSQLAAMLPMAWVFWRLLRTLPPEDIPAPVDWLAWRSCYASGLLNSLVGNLDRIVIGALLGPSAVGVLMVVRQLQHFPTVFHLVVLTVVSPVFSRLKAMGDLPALGHQLHLANDWVMRMALGLILLLTIMPDRVLVLYGADFASQGSALMLLMTLAVAANLGTGPVGILLNMTGHHVALLHTTMVTSLAVFAGYFAFVPIFGLAGVGLAVLLGNIFNNGVAIWLVQSRLGISWYDPRFRGWILPSVAAILILLALRPLLAGADEFGMQIVLLAGSALLTYLVFFGVNLLIGLHEDDRELLRAARARFEVMRRKGASPT